jgi:hypothetical protein
MTDKSYLKKRDLQTNLNKVYIDYWAPENKLSDSSNTLLLIHFSSCKHFCAKCVNILFYKKYFGLAEFSQYFEVVFMHIDFNFRHKVNKQILYMLENKSTRLFKFIIIKHNLKPVYE